MGADEGEQMLKAAAGISDSESEDSDAGSEDGGQSRCCRRASPLSAAKDERARRRHLVHMVLLVTTIAVGVLAIMWHEECGWLEAAWVITQVVTTIGYGDIVFQSDEARLFMAFYVLWLLVLVAYFLNQYVQSVFSRQSERLQAKLHTLEESADKRHILRHLKSSEKDQALKSLHRQAVNALMGPTLLFLAFVAFGTFFFMWWEHCECSYKHTAINGCTQANACETGMVKDLTTSFYMAVVTLTTVGFGDVTPVTRTGRLIAMPWMLSGILVTGMFVEALQTFFFTTQEKDDLNDEKVCREVFEKIDREKKGSLNKVEFMSFVLVHHGLVSQEALDKICSVYDTMDTNKDEVVTFDEVRHFQRTIAAAG